MRFSWAAVAGALVFASEVAAHGLVDNYTVDGVFYHGYFDKQILWVVDNSPGPEWDAPGIQIHESAFNKSPIFDTEFESPDFVCHRAATPGRSSVTVGPGSTIVFQWPTVWPRSHHGPVITMLANCEGSCHTVDKTQLKWNPIEKVGLMDPTLRKYPDDTLPAGYWAADKLHDAGGKWTFTIPEGIAPGNYTLRHEIIALHNTYDDGSDPDPTMPFGGQFYPNCFNLQINGSGTDPLASGTLGNDLYSISEPGLSKTLWIFNNTDFTNYTIPGPPVYTLKGVSSSTDIGANSTTSNGVSSPTGGVGDGASNPPGDVSNGPNSPPGDVSNEPSSPTGNGASTPTGDKNRKAPCKCCGHVPE